MGFRFRKIMPIAKAKTASSDVKSKLDSFISANAAEPATFLAATQHDMGMAITYPEIRRAIMDGHLDAAYIKQWEKDYSLFVTQHFAPAWNLAMEHGGATILNDDQNFRLDRTWEGVVNWVHDHGAEFVTNSAWEQHQAINALIAYGLSNGMHPNDLSLLIRPCVGLTKRQSEANAAYFAKMEMKISQEHPRMKPEAVRQKAKEASIKYAEKQHRYRCQMIAETELSFAFNRGQYEAVKKAQAEGRLGECVKIWHYAHSDQPCPMCVALEQQSMAVGGIAMDEQFEGDYDKVDSKGNVKTVHFQADHGLFPGQGLCPPLHPFCRCTLEYKEVAAPAFAPADEPQQSAIPQDVQTPPGMTLRGQASLGGTGDMYEYTDQDGKEWLFKPAQDKSGNEAEYRAYVQEAGYKVQSLIDPDTAVPVGVDTLDGKFGAFQEKVEGATDPQLHTWQMNLGNALSADDLAQLQREHVTDWLLCNYDSHGRNFVRDANGNIIGVDKEQAFRYINEAGAKAMGYSFHPNSQYHETEPIYNTMYRAFADGTLDLDLRNTLQYIQKIEAIPDAEYREIFRKYAESLHGQGTKAEELLDKIVDRKQSLRETYRTFFTDLLTQRTGKKQSPFLFADEVGSSGSSVQTSMMNAAALDAMKKADLVKLAKQQGLQYYNAMTKAQLVESLSDPVKAAANIQAMKAKASQKPQKQSAPATVPQTSPGESAGLPAGTIRAEDLFKDLSVIGRDKYGYAVWSDGDKVEGLNFTARRMVIDGTEYYDIAGKLREKEWRRLEGEIAKLGNATWETTVAGSDWTKSQKVRAEPIEIRYDKDSAGAVTLETSSVDEVKRAMEGWFRLRVKASGDGAADAIKLRSMVDKYGLGAICVNPTEKDEETLKLAKLLWQQAPRESENLSSLSGQALRDEIDKILQKTGIDPKRASKMVLSREANGYITYLDPQNAKEAKSKGARYVYTSVSQPEYIARNVKLGQFSSGMTRMAEGMEELGGASFAADMERGGASGVFTRMVTGNAVKKALYEDSSVAYNFQVIFDLDILNRTDYYSYRNDNYGNIRDIGSEGLSPWELAENLSQKFSCHNELVFRNGISSKYIKEIRCYDDHERDSLIKALEGEGITEINGSSIRDLVTVGRKM